MGSRIPCACDGSETVASLSPAVPGGGVGGATWSKRPPFSSQVMKTTVLAQICGFWVRVARSWLMACSP